MDRRFRLGKKQENGESSRRGVNVDEWDMRFFGSQRVERVLTANGVIERPVSPNRGYVAPAPAPPLVDDAPAPPLGDQVNNSRLRLRRDIGGGDNVVEPQAQLSLLDSWLAQHKEMRRHDLPVQYMRGYRGVMSRNAFRVVPRTGTQPTAGVDPRVDQRSLPRLDYSLGILNRQGKREFILPMLQYDMAQDTYFKLDWNQTPFSGEAADLLNWPNMFVERNRMEAKCRSYLVRPLNV